ncbi:response regulator transcription factor [Pandoraea sputorum]|uniref:response regulator transcription factor n=1 Tax=Pandoraea sputorum TaxID=93222 RepID=UPI00123EF9B7|nr:Response regulator PleD [Pandoraea sputorum]
MHLTDFPAPPTPDIRGETDHTPAWLGNRPVVLIVDDTPDNLAFLSDALQANGYVVLVALSGEAALKCLARVTPDVVLLDALMPEMDGFETCSRMKQDARHEHLPVIFMTALTESEHVVRGFRVGGIDYVTKPVRPEEVCARIVAHVLRSRAHSYAHAALSLGTRAALIVDEHGGIRWRSPQAVRQIMALVGDDGESADMLGQPRLPAPLHSWFVDWLAQGGPADAVHKFTAGNVQRSATITPSAKPGEWIVMLTESDDTLQCNALALRFGLTAREAEVLLWVSRGKANRDIGDILGVAPRTVNKHLEHLFRKLNVETRATAAALAVKVLVDQV